MPFSHNGLKTTTGMCRYTAVKRLQVDKHTLSYRLLYGNVQGCVFAKNRPVTINWPDYKPSLNYAINRKPYQNRLKNKKVIDDYIVDN